MNFENSKISDIYRLLLNLLDKINLNLLYQVLAFTIHRKI